MCTRHLLYLTDNNLSVRQWRSGHIDSPLFFSHDPAGYRQFEHYLIRHRNSSYVMIANIAEERFQVETIPRLGGEDRKAVIQRKLQQLFSNAPLSTSQCLGLQTSSRPSERVLLTALMDHLLITPWLKALDANKAALSGIQSLPFLTAALIEKLGISEQKCLVLSHQDQSFRQSFLEDGCVHFSRLTALPEDLDEDILVSIFALETERLLHYLRSKRILAENSPVTAYVFASSRFWRPLRERFDGIDKLQLALLDFSDCATKTSLKSELTQASGENLFLNLAARSGSRPQFVDNALQHHYRLKTLRQTLYTVGIGVIIACALSSCLLANDIAIIRKDINRAINEAEPYHAALEGITSTTSSPPVRTDSLLRFVNAYTELEQRSITPAGLFIEISKALQEAPDIELDRFVWNSSDKHRPLSPKTSLPGLAANNKGIAEFESARIQGVIRGDNIASPQQIIHAFDRFMDVLRKNPVLLVDIVKRPFPVESADTLRNIDFDIDEYPVRSFSIHVQRRIGP